MKRIFNRTLILTLLLLVQLSCKKEWLEPKPLSFFAPENVYVDEAGFRALLVTMRKDLKNENTGAINFLINEYAASDLGVASVQLDFYNLTPNTDRYYKYLGMFNMVYSSIKNANVLISRIDDITWADEKVKNAILAEAYWHRAYWYYRLVNTYGDVPFLGSELTEAKLDFYTHSRWTILNKIQADMEFAVQWLPATAGPGVITKGAGNHLLAKIYLANTEFDKAIAAATEVINGPYALMTERFGATANDPKRNVIWDLHRPQNFNITQNRETILAIVDRFEAPPGAKSAGLLTMRHYNSAWWNSSVRDSQGKAGMLASGPMYDSLGRGNGNVRLTPFYQYGVWAFGNQNWRNTTDLRRSNINWVDRHELLYNNPASVDYRKPINVNYYASKADTFYTIYAMPHYITYVPERDPLKVPYGGNGDWYIFRLAESYLIRAEAYYYKGALPEAANDINKVRLRAKALPVTAGQVTLDFIFDESARELFAEAPRHTELVRASYILAKLNRGGYSLSNFSEKNYFYDRLMKYNSFYTSKPSMLDNSAKIAPFHVLWPVPANVITANTLGRINQNVGYVGAESNMTPLQTIE